jgi:hypothetical protein
MSTRHPFHKTCTLDTRTIVVQIAGVEIRSSKLTPDALLDVFDAEHTELSQTRQLPSLIDQHVMLTELACIDLAVQAEELLSALHGRKLTTILSELQVVQCLGFTN